MVQKLSINYVVKFQHAFATYIIGNALCKLVGEIDS